MLHCYTYVSWNPGEVQKLPAVTKCKSCGSLFPVSGSRWIHSRLVPWALRTPFPHKRKLEWFVTSSLSDATAAKQLLILERCLLATRIRSTWKYFHSGQSCSRIQGNVSREELCVQLCRASARILPSKFPPAANELSLFCETVWYLLLSDLQPHTVSCLYSLRFYDF